MDENNENLKDQQIDHELNDQDDNSRFGDTVDQGIEQLKEQGKKKISQELSARGGRAVQRAGTKLRNAGATAKITGQAIANAARASAIAIWSGITAVWAAIVSSIGLPATIIIIVIIFSLGAFALINRYRSGTEGNQSPNPLSVSAATTNQEMKISMNDLNMLFGQKYIISDNPKNFYFSQADPKFNKEKLKGRWNKCGPELKCAGCALTTMTMALRYFGVNNVTPVDFANYWAEQHGGNLNIAGSMEGPINHFLKINGLPNKNAKRIYGVPSVSTIKGYIERGIPIVTQGNRICGSSGQHWVLIIGISKDERSVIISDPAGGWRSSPARYCNMSDTNIKSYIVYE